MTLSPTQVTLGQFTGGPPRAAGGGDLGYIADATLGSLYAGMIVEYGTDAHDVRVPW